ncbi:hypothetical protein LINPERHAP1_LOCUS29848 [Linum perenne]
MEYCLHCSTYFGSFMLRWINFGRLDPTL